MGMGVGLDAAAGVEDGSGFGFVLDRGVGGAGGKKRPRGEDEVVQLHHAQLLVRGDIVVLIADAGQRLKRLAALGKS